MYLAAMLFLGLWMFHFQRECAKYPARTKVYAARGVGDSRTWRYGGGGRVERGWIPQETGAPSEVEGESSVAV